MPNYSPRYDGIDVAPTADPFAKWYSERHGHEPGPLIEYAVSAASGGQAAAAPPAPLKPSAPARKA
jgi:hypothetical protein